MPPTTGRTTADAVTEITKDVLGKMGRNAPYLILLVVIGFGLFKFLELQDEKMKAVRVARVEALQENLDTVTKLKGQVLADATAITNLQSMNVDVINRQIQAQQNIIATIASNLETIAELSAKAQEHKAEVEEKARQLKDFETERQRLEVIIEAQRSEEDSARVLLERLALTTRVATHLVDVLNRDEPLIPTREPAQIAERYEGVEPSHIGEGFFGEAYYGTFRIRGAVEMAEFLKWLKINRPSIALKLEQAGGSDAAVRADGSFRRTWKRLAEQPVFEEAQRAFIRDTDVRRALKNCTINSGIDIAARSVALRSVLWAATVQHGSSDAARLCRDAFKSFAGRSVDDWALIEELYRLRVERKHEHFPNHDGVIYTLLDVRYALEKTDAKAILEAFPSDE